MAPQRQKILLFLFFLISYIGWVCQSWTFWPVKFGHDRSFRPGTPRRSPLFPIHLMMMSMNPIEDKKPPQQISDTSNRQSTHLQLTGRYDKDSDDQDSDAIESDFVEVYEAFGEDNQCRVASLCEESYIEVFYRHLCKQSCTGRRSWKANLNVEEDVNTLKEFWREGKLLSLSEKFPFDRRSLMKSFGSNVRSSVNRMKGLLRDLKKEDGIVEFLRQQNISNLSYDDLVNKPESSYNETISKLKTFATWFKDQFPYYYGSCENCGSRDNISYSGIMAPTKDEAIFLANVVETYVCGNCSHFTRFPRYNDVEIVLKTKKGRCGEYSALIVRMLKALKYDTRWVADISDHLWGEVLIDGRWVHFDPCEAAIDEPLIYQGWGKNQTYIVAYDCQNRDAVDVTSAYTSNIEGMLSRRFNDNQNDATIAQLLNEASKNLSVVT